MSDGNTAASGGAGAGPLGEVPFNAYLVKAGPDILLFLEGELDLFTAPRFLEDLDRAVFAGAGTHLQLDLSRLTFLDLPGARALARVSDLVRGEGGRLSVTGLDEPRLPAARAVGLTRYLAAGRDDRDQTT